MFLKTTNSSVTQQMSMTFWDLRLSVRSCKRSCDVPISCDTRNVQGNQCNGVSAIAHISAHNARDRITTKCQQTVTIESCEQLLRDGNVSRDKLCVVSSNELTYIATNGRSLLLHGCCWLNVGYDTGTAGQAHPHVQQHLLYTVRLPSTHLLWSTWTP